MPIASLVIISSSHGARVRMPINPRGHQGYGQESLPVVPPIFIAVVMSHINRRFPQGKGVMQNMPFEVTLPVSFTAGITQGVLSTLDTSLSLFFGAMFLSLFQHFWRFQGKPLSAVTLDKHLSHTRNIAAFVLRKAKQYLCAE